MKNGQKCPKCSSIEVVKVKTNDNNSLAGNFNINLGIKRVLINRYICLECGFVEDWIEGKELEKIKKAWKDKNLSIEY